MKSFNFVLSKIINNFLLFYLYFFIFFIYFYDFLSIQPTKSTNINFKEKQNFIIFSCNIFTFFKFFISIVVHFLKLTEINKIPNFYYPISK